MYRTRGASPSAGSHAASASAYWNAATSATIHAASEITTRTNPRAKANTVDRPMIPMTTKSNAVMA